MHIRSYVGVTIFHLPAPSSKFQPRKMRNSQITITVAQSVPNCFLILVSQALMESWLYRLEGSLIPKALGMSEAFIVLMPLLSLMSPGIPKANAV